MEHKVAIKTKTNAGIGLLEILIGLAIISIAMGGLASMITFSNRGAHSVRKKLNHGELLSTIRQVIDSPALCNASFVGSGQVFDNGQLATIKFGTGLTIDQGTHSSFQGGALIIKSLQFKNVLPPVAGISTGTLEVVVDMQGTDTDNLVGGSTRTDTMNVSFNVDASKNILGCTTGVTSFYTVQNPSVNGSVVPANCASGDIAVGGGGQPVSPNLPISSFPVSNATGAPTGWMCHGANSISACWVVCQKS